MVGLAFAGVEEQRDAEQASVRSFSTSSAALQGHPFMRTRWRKCALGGVVLVFVQDVAQLYATYDRFANVFLSQDRTPGFFGATLDGDTRDTSRPTWACPRSPIVTVGSWSHNVGSNDNTNIHRRKSANVQGEAFAKASTSRTRWRLPPSRC